MLLRFGGLHGGQLSLELESVDLKLVSVIMTGGVTMMGIIIILCHLCWSQHQPTHLELVSSFFTFICLCILGGIILAKTYIKETGALDIIMNSINEVSNFEAITKEEQNMIQGFGIMLISCGLVHLVDFFFIISHPKIAWLRK